MSIKKGTIRTRLLGLVCLSLSIFALMPQDVEASHFRYGTLSWVTTDNPGEVEFRMKVVFRRSFFFPTPTIGGTVNVGNMSLGDGTNQFLTATVTNINVVDDYFEGEVVFRKTYAGPGPYNVVWNQCCRIFGIVNASSAFWRLETTVDPYSDNDSPVSNQFPIVNVGQGTASTFFVNAADPNGDNLRFRIASTSESGIPNNPTNLQIDQFTGEITWNNSLAALNSLWAVQIIVEDLDDNGNVKTKTPVDFMMRVVQVQAAPPSCEVTPVGPITVASGNNVTFDVTALAGDPGFNVSLAGIGLPSGSSMSPTLPVNATGSVSSQFNWTPTAIQTGSFVLNFSATDQFGQQAQCGTTINVISNRPPVADAGEDQIKECPDCDVTFDGSGSSDPDGDQLTYSWTGSFGTLSGDSPTVKLPLGLYEVILTVDDGNGETDSDTVMVTVEDTTAPELVTQAEPHTLWPPNHKYHNISIENFIESVSDACDTDVDLSGVVITRVTSDEPEDQQSSNNGKGRNGGGGDGNTSDDIVISNDGVSVDLRAERLGGGNGRVYTVYVGVEDGSGNITESSFQVHVPHNKKSDAVDDGLANGYEVTGLSTSVSAKIAAGSDDELETENDSYSDEITPQSFTLQQNYPNPFNPSTIIGYEVTQSAHVSIEVYDLTGRLIATLVDEAKSEGSYEVTFNASNLNSGVYLYRIRAGNFIDMKKMTLIK